MDQCPDMEAGPEKVVEKTDNYRCSNYLLFEVLDFVLFQDKYQYNLAPVRMKELKEQDIRKYAIASPGFSLVIQGPLSLLHLLPAKDRKPSLFYYFKHSCGEKWKLIF